MAEGVDMTGFRPMLFPNDEINLEDIKEGLYLVSNKLDGIRCMIVNGEMLSRTMKPIRNIKLREKFQPLMDYTKANKVLLDGEIYGLGMTFQEISSQVMSLDTEVSEELSYYCFDCIDFTDLDHSFDKTAMERYDDYLLVCAQFPEIMMPVVQFPLEMPRQADQAQQIYEEFIKDGMEGLIFKRADSKYYQGRPSTRMGVGYKYKPFITWDCKVIGVKQATKVDPTAEKKKDAFGHSKTSRKKDDRIAIERAGALLVDWQGKELLVSLALTNEEKEEIWANQSKYIGKTIELKGMMVGAKDVPRHPVFIRWREDKD